MSYPDFAMFQELSQKGNLIPVYREIMADTDTPVTAFRKLDDGQRYSFLFESIEGGEKWARYSFIGSNPAMIIRSRDKIVEILENGKTTSFASDDALSAIRDIMSRFTPVEVEGLPRFFGGAVGYIGYDMARQFEHLPTDKPAVIGAYDSYLLITGSIVIFDTVKQKIKVVSNAHLTEKETIKESYEKATAAIDAIIKRLRAPLPIMDAPPVKKRTELTSNISRTDYETAVEKTKEYIRAGDIIQAVPSQRFSGKLESDPFNIYRVMRTLNPSPYMFFLRLDNTIITGASPEVMVRKEGSRVELRPIAGTRPRGANYAEDTRLAEELLSDPKERAEHVMLVDLGRNDLGRVCQTGSVRVSELMIIERYSHVMHIVSNVQGELRNDCDSFDLVRATLPAGTLSGAPKIRAMEIIDELEPARREIYGGAVGYFSFSGNMDMAITIRTLVVKDGIAHLQAGGGVVADSNPTEEWQETVNKAMAVRRAIEITEEGLE